VAKIDNCSGGVEVGYIDRKGNVAIPYIFVHSNPLRDLISTVCQLETSRKDWLPLR
jgi:hypothetical protein